MYMYLCVCITRMLHTHTHTQPYVSSNLNFLVFFFIFFCAAWWRRESKVSRKKSCVPSHQVMRAFFVNCKHYFFLRWPFKSMLICVLQSEVTCFFFAFFPCCRVQVRRHCTAARWRKGRARCAGRALIAPYGLIQE